MHLSPEVAIDLVEARTTQTDTEFWSHHIDECGKCRNRLEDWSAFHFTLTDRDLEDAPQHLILQAEKLFTTPEADARRPLTEVLASLLFDSLTQPAFAGARGGGNGSRQMVYRALNVDIHLKVSAENAHRKVYGQVQARQNAEFPTCCNVFLIKDGVCQETAVANSFGEFEFSSVPESPVLIRVDVPEMNLVSTLSL